MSWLSPLILLFFHALLFPCVQGREKGHQRELPSLFCVWQAWGKQEAKRSTQYFFHFSTFFTSSIFQILVWKAVCPTTKDETLDILLLRGKNLKWQDRDTRSKFWMVGWPIKFNWDHSNRRHHFRSKSIISDSLWEELSFSMVKCHSGHFSMVRVWFPETYPTELHTDVLKPPGIDTPKGILFTVLRLDYQCFENIASNQSP